MNKKIILISTLVVVLAAFIGGAYIYKQSEKKRIDFLAQENSELFIRPYSPVLGEKGAKVYLVEFLDPECGSCRAFYPPVKQLLAKYKGKVKLVVRYAPFHKNSRFAISILEAARKQGKYWQALENLFRYQPEWGSHHDPQPEKIWNRLPETGVDIDQIKKDMKDPQIGQHIDQDVKDGKELGVKATPTFYVNGKPLPSFGLQQLVQALEEAVDEAY